LIYDANLLAYLPKIEGRKDREDFLYLFFKKYILVMKDKLTTKGQAG